jgi:probable rRNA maturation factor
MEITVRKTRPARTPLKKLRELGEALLRSEGWTADSEVDLWLCSDEEIRALNLEYRKQDKATDVLSFPQYARGETPIAGLPVALGDVVISMDTAAAQARARGQSLEREIVWLFLHSLLHLVGYDDDTEEGLEEMIARAAAVFPSAAPAA